MQLFTRRSQVLQQFYFTIKVNEESFVLGLHEHLFQKTAARAALRVEDVGLTATGVDEQTQREREIRVLRKVANTLWAAVFLKCEIVLREIADDLAMFVAHGDGQRNYFDVDRDSGSDVLSTHRRADSGKSGQRADQRIGNPLPQG